MKGRKTINLSVLVDYANYQLKRTDKVADVGFKAGICGMLEKALISTNNYNGYSYLNNNDTKLGTLGYYSRTYHYKS
jgi:hypothetical protein